MPGTIVEVIAGPWQGRIGTVEAPDRELAGWFPEGSVMVRLRAGCAGRPTVERVVVKPGEVALVDLRVREGGGR